MGDHPTTPKVLPTASFNRHPLPPHPKQAVKIIKTLRRMPLNRCFLQDLQYSGESFNSFDALSQDNTELSGATRFFFIPCNEFGVTPEPRKKVFPGRQYYCIQPIIASMNGSVAIKEGLELILRERGETV
jgi:hypothetical protein